MPSAFGEDLLIHAFLFFGEQFEKPDLLFFAHAEVPAGGLVAVDDSFLISVGDH